jgi:hypothetical protein
MPIIGADDKPSDLVQGTLHMLILKTLALEPLHGDGIGLRAKLKLETRDWGIQTAAIARILDASLGEL